MRPRPYLEADLGEGEARKMRKLKMPASYYAKRKAMRVPCFVRAKKGPLDGRICFRDSRHKGFHSDGVKEWPRQRGHRP